MNPPPVQPRKSKISTKTNGYYVAPEDRKHKTEHEEIVSEILGDDIEGKIKISKKLSIDQRSHESKLENYDKFDKNVNIDNLFKELDKRLSAESKKVLASYKLPDYKTLQEVEENIDLILKPNPLLPSNKLSFKKKDYFKDSANVKQIDNQVELDGEKRIAELINQFPKTKTNTALLQYAHILSKEFLRNQYLEKKHQDFLNSTELIKQKTFNDLHAMQSNDSSLSSTEKDISIKHSYNRDFKAKKHTLDMNAQKYMESNTQVATDPTTASVVENSESETKSRAASICISDSKCGTVKIGPSRQSIMSENIIAEEISPQLFNTNFTGGSMSSRQSRYSNQSRRQTYAKASGMRNQDRAKWLRAANKYKSMYGGMPLNNDYHTMVQQQRAIQFSMLCLAEERHQRKTSVDLDESIDFLKHSLSGFDPTKDTHVITPPAISLPKSESVRNNNDIKTEKQAIKNTEEPGVLPEESSKRDSFEKNQTKIKSKLSRSVSAEDVYKELTEITIEKTTEVSPKPSPEPEQITIKKTKKKSKKKNKLEPIIEVASLMEGRKSTMITGVEADLMLTTLKTMENDRKSREFGYTEKTELERRLSTALNKRPVINRKHSSSNEKEEVAQSTLDAPPIIIPRKSSKARAGITSKKAIFIPDTDAIPIATEPKVVEASTTPKYPPPTESTTPQNLPPIESTTPNTAPPKKDFLQAKKKQSMLSFFKRSKGRKTNNVAPPLPNLRKQVNPKQIKKEIVGDNDEFADVKTYDKLIDLVTCASIAGTIEESKNITTAKINKNNALGIIVENDSDVSSESENDMRLSGETTPKTIASDFNDDVGSFVDLNDTDAMKARFKRDLKRSTMLTEYHFFTEKDIELIFDDEKFNKDYITFDRKRKSFDIFATYMLASAKMEVEN